MAKKSVPTNIAMALKCARKVRMGRACTMAELRAVVMLLDDARKTSLSTIRNLKERAAFLERMLNR